jgi:hypothetical protein
VDAAARRTPTAFSDTGPSRTPAERRFVVPWAGEDFPPDYSDAVVLKEYEIDD